ncbi:hypothetical protein CCUG63695_03011 [Mycobacteroides franklinii]|uniref:Uncharacterized protein n=1 Tax=Mycobacteroides franklinii TaxID=948102 RepID=A0A4R8R9Q1_9MYCO|nr:hypothetical protein CCUG64054_03084 [Mycobacteroides franklinii]TDZ50167.1 hypothetical protein CCUG63697_01669 [Mycobacteroides franklinii]TDZ56588.1 hypothetical protein CCUG63696_03086 [Mycobacteroides franklinii]TDZ63529.1 hypothetical protein CCUG63695_03011 [Mycobacteroides franklinii]TDZ69926.1 hypothetical protein CCUG64056_03084 [Mycobacteroides franklinii]
MGGTGNVYLPALLLRAHGTGRTSGGMCVRLCCHSVPNVIRMGRLHKKAEPAPSRRPIKAIPIRGQVYSEYGM